MKGGWRHGHSINNPPRPTDEVSISSSDQNELELTKAASICFYEAYRVIKVYKHSYLN